MHLVGIYSFPKSGNTWIRAIIANCMSENAGPGPHPHDGVPDLPQIPDLHRHSLDTAVEWRGYRFFKLHAGRHLREWGGVPLAVTKVIHVRRNPLDVFMSYMNFISKNVTGHASIGFDTVDDIRGTELFEMYFHSFIVSGHVAPRFAHVTGSYFEHNRYWLTQSEVPAVTLRYEDLLGDPCRSMSFLENWLDLDEAELARAIVKADSDTEQDGRFFWRRRAKTYLDYLSPEQIERFIRYRGEECEEMGYSPDYLRSDPDYW